MHDTVNGRYIPIFKLLFAGDGTLHRRPWVAKGAADTPPGTRTYAKYLYTGETEERKQKYLLVPYGILSDLKARFPTFMSPADIEECYRFRGDKVQRRLIAERQASRTLLKQV